MARKLADQGVLVPPSAWAPEAPHVHNLVEVFYPAFFKQDPLLQSATSHYEKKAGEILQGAGVKDVGKLSEPTAAVPTEEAGRKVLARITQESQTADAKLQAEIDKRRTQVQATKTVTGIEHEATVEGLRKAEAESRAAAQAIIDKGFENIQNGVTEAMQRAEAGTNSGDLWQKVGQKLVQLKSAIQNRAKVGFYDKADQLAGEHLPNIEGLPETAKAFLDELPEGFENKYPAIVKQLRDLSGVEELDKEGNPTGNWKKEPVQPTFGQLHNLRSIIRSKVSWYDLPSDIQNGTYKFFAHKVDNVLHDPNAVPELKDAAHMLDKGDEFYRKNMRVFSDKNLQAVMNGLESGQPADPKNLFDVIVKEGRTDFTNKARKLVGPNLWAGVKAADVQEMMDSAKSLVPGQIDGRKFAQEVLKRYRTGMLEAVHGKEATGELLRQAQYIEMLDGRLSVAVRPGDSMASVVAKARATAEQLKAVAKQDPLTALNKEMKTLERERAQKMSRMAQERKADKLGFLYDPSVGATEAVDKILGNEDLVLAAANKFGEGFPRVQDAAAGLCAAHPARHDRAGQALGQDFSGNSADHVSGQIAQTDAGPRQGDGFPAWHARRHEGHRARHVGDGQG